jgi:ABC-type nickel/cobalt efflux system permease component RcnA
MRITIVTTSRSHAIGNVALGLSLLTFAIYFLNVLFGGPLGRKPWMSDVSEMLVLFLAVLLFVAGTLAREAEAKAAKAEATRDNTTASERSSPSLTE